MDDVFSLSVEVQPVVPVFSEDSAAPQPSLAETPEDSFTQEPVAKHLPDLQDNGFDLQAFMQAADPHEVFLLTDTLAVDMNGFGPEAFYNAYSAVGDLGDFIHGFDGQNGVIQLQADGFTFIH